MIPQTLEQLLSQAQSIAGLTFGELADELHIPVPIDLKRDKGWVGMLLERALGATAGSKAEQDFSHLGVELKTLPINAEGYPLETTFVSLAPLVQNSGLNGKIPTFAINFLVYFGCRLKAAAIFHYVNAISAHQFSGSQPLSKNVN